MFWNIRHLGDARNKKSEVIIEVSRFIQNESPDILCIQELVVDEIDRAVKIINAINAELSNNSHIQYNYIFCPHNGFEIYVYLYKGSNNLKALVLDKNAPDYVTYEDIEFYDNISSQKFKLTSGSTQRNYDDNFPLFHYKKRGESARAPGLGLFECTKSDNTKHYIAIFNWHNEAKSGLPIFFIRGLASDQLFYDEELDITTTNNNTVTFNNIIIGGDFNHNLVKTPFTEDLNFKKELNERTHLNKFNVDNDGTYNDSASLRDHRLDNILTLLSTLSSSNALVTDLPAHYMTYKNLAKTALDNSDLITQLISSKSKKKAIINQFTKKDKISKQSKSKYSEIINGNGIDKFGINIYAILEDYISDEVEKINTIPTKQKQILKKKSKEFMSKTLTHSARWKNRSANINGLLWNDVLAFTQEWLSDHLPVSIELN